MEKTIYQMFETTDVEKKESLLNNIINCDMEEFEKIMNGDILYKKIHKTFDIDYTLFDLLVLYADLCDILKIENKCHNKIEFLINNKKKSQSLTHILMSPKLLELYCSIDDLYKKIKIFNCNNKFCRDEICDVPILPCTLVCTTEAAEIFFNHGALTDNCYYIYGNAQKYRMTDTISDKLINKYEPKSKEIESYFEKLIEKCELSYILQFLGIYPLTEFIGEPVIKKTLYNLLKIFNNEFPSNGLLFVEIHTIYEGRIILTLINNGAVITKKMINECDKIKCQFEKFLKE